MKSGQPNKCLIHWHLENLMASFFYCSRLSSAQAPKQRPIIDPHPVEQTAYRRDIKDNGYKSVFTNSWLLRQRNRSWIKGLGKNLQKSELIHCWQCLFVRGHRTVSPRTLRNTCVCTMSRPRVACWHGSRQNRMRIMSADRWLKNKIARLNGIQCELVNMHLP